MSVEPVARGGQLVVPQHVIDSYMSPGARRMVQRGMNAQTLKTYAWQWHLFRLWCEDHNRTWAPASESTLVEYLHSWESRPLHIRCHVNRCGHRPAPSTMWIWYSAVRFYHRAGKPPLPWEGGMALQMAMKTYGEDMVELGWVPEKAPRAYESDVTRMVDALDVGTPKGLRDRAIILTNFYTAARASDLATYRLTDLSRTPKGIELELRNSKTNKAVGRKVERRRIFTNPVHPDYCGVNALNAYTGWLAGQGITTGALVRPFNRYGQLVRGEQDKISYKIASVNVSQAVQQAAIRAGVENGEHFTSHSLRRGRATQQRELLVDPIEIARAYGWVPGGAIVEYLEEAEGWSATAPGAVGFL